VCAGVHLAVAGTDVNAFRIEAVRVEALAVDTLVVVRAGKAFRERLPALTSVLSSVDGELTKRDAEVVLAVVQRHHEHAIGRVMRHCYREAVEGRQSDRYVFPGITGILRTEDAEVCLSPDSVRVLRVEPHAVQLVDGGGISAGGQSLRHLLHQRGQQLLPDRARHDRVLRAKLPRLAVAVRLVW